MKFLVSMFVIVFTLIGCASTAQSREEELHELYNMFQKGSGYDDEAFALFLKNKERYYEVLLHFLSTAEPNSSKEDAAFLFGEIAMEYNKPIKNKIVELSKNHPVDNTRCFWVDVLSNRFQSVHIEGFDDSIVKGHAITDTGSSCVSSP